MSLKKTIPAIDAPLTGVQLIQASAGTGKTWTLSALFARLVLERGLEPKQILAITFTKAPPPSCATASASGWWKRWPPCSAPPTAKRWTIPSTPPCWRG